MIGSIPDIFNSFPRLLNLTLSLNNLTGSLPASFNGSSIQNLKLDNQKVGLTGNIDRLTGMNNLSVLWLHGNLFTGTIPTSFASLPHFRILPNKFLINDNVSFDNCRGGSCKVFIRMVVTPPPPGYLPPKPASGEKPNVGAVVGFTILLVIVLAGFASCLWWHGQKVTTLQIPMVLLQKSEEQIARVQRQHPGQQLKHVKKKPKNMEGLGQVKDVKKKPKILGDLGQQPVQGEEEKKKPEKIEGLGQQPTQEKDVKKKPEKFEGLGQQPVQEKDVKKKPEKFEGLGQQPVQGKDEKKKPEKFKGLGQHGKKEDGKQPQEVVEEQGFSLKKFSYNYVRFMTNNFVNVIGNGGFGDVYKGVMNETFVAVKRLNQLHSTVDDFKNEVEALGRTSHFNLVKLIGYCVEDEHKLLVYEYVKNGPLESWIFGTDPKKTLSWLEKNKIVLAIAEGLAYLHENCEKKILHRDLKPPNVLLDDNKNAKLCDFGISKLLERDQSSTSTACCGTPGYAAPEIVNGIRKISEKVDVYSFGVVVLEILFGKRYSRLVSFKIQANQLPGLVRQLGDEMRKNGKDIERIGKLAISCLSDEPEARPSMSEIVGAIKGANAKLGKN